MNPTKTIFFLLLFIIFSSPISAQFLIGPKVGFQLSKVAYEDEVYKEEHTTLFKPGFNAGVVLNYKVNATFSLHTELFYSRKGKVEKKEMYGVKNVAAYHYLDLPLMLRVSYHRKIKKQNVEFYGNVGPSFCYWLGGKGTLTANELVEYTGSDKMKYKIKFEEGDSYGETLYLTGANRLQTELNLGGGVVVDMAKGQKLMVDFRYGFGLGNTFLGTKNGGNYGLMQYTDNFEGVNHVISLSVAYLFEFNLQAMLKKGKF